MKKDLQFYLNLAYHHMLLNMSSGYKHRISNIGDQRLWKSQRVSVLPPECCLSYLKTATMDYLPPELVTRIFTFLDPTSVIACRQVCSRWRNISERLTNPLYLPRVMRHIMMHLPFRVLLRLRLVSKLWKVGLDTLTFHEVLVLNGRTSIDPRANLETLGHLGNPFPSRIISLEMCSSCRDGHNEDDFTDAVFEQSGKHIFHLQILLHQTNHVESAFKRAAKYFTNLRGLVISEKSRLGSNYEADPDTEPNEPLPLMKHLKFLKLDDSESQLKCTALYQKILKNVPNLEHLDIHGFYHMSIDIVKLLPTLTNLFRLRIDVEDPFTEETLRILSISKIPLESLSLQLNGWGDEEECLKSTMLLHESLKNFGSSLEKLELKLNWEPRGQSKFEPQIVSIFSSSSYLINVRKLKLVGFCRQLDFLRDFVSLQSLLIVDYEPEKQRVVCGEQEFYDLVPSLVEAYFLTNNSFNSQSGEDQDKLRHFMMDSSDFPKYCGLYQLEFP